MISAGAAAVVVEPPAGLPMCGYAARTKPAHGSHDPLSVRALAVGDTVLAVVDVIGLDREFCARVRRRCAVSADKVLLCALHSHGGPVSMRGRLGADPDRGFIEQLEQACVTAIDEAVAAQRPVLLTHGLGDDPDVARNRRHADGPTDPSLPVLRVRDAQDEKIIAVLVNYACHPVVLGADNLLWTADYPHFVRRDLEAKYPGAVALFVTGMVGDVNPGHSAQSSISLEAQEKRNFATAEALGARIAAAALAAKEQPLGSKAHAACAEVELRLQQRETRSVTELAKSWQAAMDSADPAHAAALQACLHWSTTAADKPLLPMCERVAVLNWGGLPIIGLPGEIFTATALELRAKCGAAAVLAGFADDNPGYLPPQDEYRHGGYEIDEAYRYYGQPAGFAPGSAEALASKACQLHAAMGVGDSRPR